MNRNPEMKNQILQFMVLFIALAETSAIYGLVIAFKLLNG
jgi:F0F1-type ATP synthase membrane subunit c/vacuolar-type H+-ATPase subunit K